MKKWMILAVVLAIVVSAAAVPALADHNRHDRNGHDGNDSEVEQDNEQDVQSGAISQGIIIEGPGDNSNQCIGLQPITNTGNATSQIGVLQYANKDTDVELDDSGNLTISPSQTTTCDQQVNQAATASGQ